MRKYIMEAIGSFSYLLFGAIIQLFVMNYLTNINFILEVFYISFGYAFSFFVIYFLLNQYNNYYVNPIFSFSSWLQNKTSNKDFVFISLFQIIGAFLSGLILKLCFPDIISSIVLTYGDGSIFHSSLDILIFIEFFFSFILCFGYLFIGERLQNKLLRAITLGLLFFVLLFFSVPYTGGSVNPVRFLVSNLFVNFDYLRQGGFYLFSSLEGALISTILYHIITYLRDNDLT